MSTNNTNNNTKQKNNQNNLWPRGELYLVVLSNYAIMESETENSNKSSIIVKVKHLKPTLAVPLVRK